MKLSHLILPFGIIQSTKSDGDSSDHSHGPMSHVEKMEHLCASVKNKNFVTTLNRGSSLISLKKMINSKDDIVLRASRETTIGTTTEAYSTIIGDIPVTKSLPVKTASRHYFLNDAPVIKIQSNNNEVYEYEDIEPTSTTSTTTTKTTTTTTTTTSTTTTKILETSSTLKQKTLGTTESLVA